MIDVNISKINLNFMKDHIMKTFIKLAGMIILGLTLTACGGGGGGEVTYTVTPSVSGTGGTISPAKAVSVPPGQTTTFTVTPNAGYTATISGSCPGTFTSSTVYVTKAITADCTVVAAFTATPSTYYIVTPSVSSGNGAISPNNTVTVQSGKTTSFTVTPDAGYVASVGGTCKGTLTGSTYTTNAITSNCTVVMTFTATDTGPLTFVYESQPAPANTSDVAALLALLNREGAKGYFYQDPSGSCDRSDSLTFVNDSTGKTYSYELLVLPSSTTDFITQANAEGVKGYRYETECYLLDASLTTYALYRKDSRPSVTYTYVADSAVASTTDFLTQANGRGQSGYWLLPNAPSNLVEIVYVKNNASNAAYTYDVLTWPTTLNDLLTQLTSEGSKGYRVMYRGSYMTQKGLVYIRDQTQTATFTYQPSATNSSVAQKNTVGTQGYAYWGWVWFLPSGSFYVKASNCKGFLCTALNPAVFLGYPID